MGMDEPPGPMAMACKKPSSVSSVMALFGVHLIEQKLVELVQFFV